jgi:hypothetical protein
VFDMMLPLDQVAARYGPAPRSKSCSAPEKESRP